MDPRALAGLLPALGALVALLAGCGELGGTRAPSSAPSSNLYLRNAFDTDPSVYLGRFVRRGERDLDESSAIPSSCSALVTHRFVDGGGVRVSETMRISSELAARIGVPVVASARGSAERSQEVRVEYELTGKMIAEISDPEAFMRCCDARPDQCTDRFIGEFLQGRGTVYRHDNRSASLSGEGRDPSSGVGGGASASREHAWSQAIEFPNPVYFAFKVTPSALQGAYQRASSTCGAWVERPPVEPGFMYFVGSSGASRSADQARNRAQWSARHQAFAAAAAHAVDFSEDQDFDAETSEAEKAALHWTMGMQFVESCVEVDHSGRRPRYVGRVLGRLPESERPGPGAPLPAGPGPADMVPSVDLDTLMEVPFGELLEDATIGGEPVGGEPAKDAALPGDFAGSPDADDGLR